MAVQRPLFTGRKHFSFTRGRIIPSALLSTTQSCIVIKLEAGSVYSFFVLFSGRNKVSAKIRIRTE